MGGQNSLKNFLVLPNELYDFFLFCFSLVVCFVFVFLAMICLLIYFFHLQKITSHYELKTDWGKTQETNVFLWNYFFYLFYLCIYLFRTLQCVTKGSFHRDKNNR